MGQRKLKKFAEVATFPNVFQPDDVKERDFVFRLKGKWNRDFFKNDNPITLELGCGRGEYTVALAQRFPHRNFIGMDVKGARIWKGAKQALALKLNNAAFVRNRVDFIESYFAPGEVSEIWLPFPDPFPRKENKRLMSDMFLERYRNFAAPGSIIHLKTDNENLYSFTLEQIKKNNLKMIFSCEDIYANEMKLDEKRRDMLLGIQTYYEKKFVAMGKKIFYVEFAI